VAQEEQFAEQSAQVPFAVRYWFELHVQVFKVEFKLNVGKHSDIIPVKSSQDAEFAGHLVQTLLPGLNSNSGQTVIFAQPNSV